MIVSDAKRIAREWADENLPAWPNVVGAILAGSVNEKDDAAAWTVGSDVDLWVFQTGTPTERPPKLAHRGLILEVATKHGDDLADVDRILGEPHLAPHVAGGTIVYDPAGVFARLHQQVRPRWAEYDAIRRRMDWASGNSRSKYERCVNATGKGLVGPLCVFVLGVRNSAALAPIAAMQNPTLRRCLSVQKEIFARYGFEDLHEQTLGIIGATNLSANSVRGLLAPLPGLFRQACAVARTPFWASFELEPAAEAMFIEGTREMIDAGRPREAVLFILFIYYFCLQAITTDGPPEMKTEARAQLADALAALGIGSLADMQARSRQGLDLLVRVDAACETIARKVSAAAAGGTK